MPTCDNEPKRECDKPSLIFHCLPLSEVSSFSTVAGKSSECLLCVYTCTAIAQTEGGG